MLQESASAIPSSTWASIIRWFTPTVLFVVLNLMIGTIVVISSFANQKQQQNHDPNKLARTTSVLHRLKSINFYAHYRSHQEPQNPPSIQRKPTPDSSTLVNSEMNQNIETQSQYFFQEFHQENVRTPQPQESHIFRENPQETQTQFVFEQKDSQTQFVFEQKDSNFDDFEQAHEEEVEEDDEDQLPSMDEIYSQLKGCNFGRSKSDTKPAAGEVPAKLPTKMKKSASMKSAFGHFEEEKIVEARRPATVRERSNAKVTDGDEGVDAKADDFINKFKQQLKLQRLDSILRYKNMIGMGSGGR